MLKIFERFNALPRGTWKANFSTIQCQEDDQRYFFKHFMILNNSVNWNLAITQLIKLIFTAHFLQKVASENFQKLTCDIQIVWICEIFRTTIP